MSAILHPSTDFSQITVEHPAGFQVILVRQGETIHAWRNRCPHIGVGLDWGDGRCLTAPNTLTCMMHGATFQADTGLCTDGPCRGDVLTAVPITVIDGKVVAA